MPQSIRSWRDVRILPLTINMRVVSAGPSSDTLRRFCAWQMRIGDGTEERFSDADAIAVAIPDAHCVKTGTAIDLINTIYPERDHDSLRQAGKRAILAPRKNNVRAIDSVLMGRVRADPQIIYSVD